MSGNTWASVGVGIVLAVAVIASGGTATVALFAFSLGATATSLVLGPEQQQSQGGLRPDELQINSASEDVTIPVVFGTTRVPANYIYVGFDLFEANPVYSTPQGGKGGSDPEPQQVGFTYNVPLHYGICMGEIDALLKIVGSPGLDEFAVFDDDGLEFTDGQEETITAKFSETRGDQNYTEGGSAKIYPGSLTQGSDATVLDDNHRAVCWIRFDKYVMTGSPAPRSLLFEVRRMPQVIADDGSPISGFPVRASTDDTEPEYYDANPAAVAWEILKNPIWGKGMEVAELDLESFRDAADYYQRARLGISTAMGKTSVNEFMGRLRDVFGLWVWWDGEKMRARCIYDRDTAYSPRTRISAEDVIDSPTFNRPSLSGTYNELRLEFTNRESNWQKEVATSMDLAHVETIGGVRTQTMDASEIGTRRAAELLCHAQLRAMAYPGATATMRLRRTYSGLQPGSFVEFLWDEWRESGMATTFWRVLSVDDDDQGAEGLTVTLMEDLYATAIDGEIADFTAPVPTIDTDIPLETSDLNDGDLFGDRPVGSLRPIVLWEPNSWVSQMNRRILVAPTREKGYVQSTALSWRLFGDSVTNELGNNGAVPINGQLMDAIPANWPKLARGGAYEFRIQTYYEPGATSFAAATGLVIDDADHFSELTRKLQAMMMINGEIFRVGFAENTATGVVTVRTYMRGELGSEKQAHAVDDDIVFFPTFNPDRLLMDAKGMPTDDKVVIQVRPVSTAFTISEDQITPDFAPASGLGIRFEGDSVKPFAPVLVSATRSVNTWTVKIRPRVWFGGAGYHANFEEDLTRFVTDLTTLSLALQKDSGGDVVTVAAGTSYSTPPFTMPPGLSIDSLNWKPDDGSLTGGIITLEVTFDSNPANLLISGSRNGFASVQPLTIPQP